MKTKRKSASPAPFTVTAIPDRDQSALPALVVFNDCENGDAIVNWVFTNKELALMKQAARRHKQSLADWILGAVREHAARSGVIPA